MLQNFFSGTSGLVIPMPKRDFPAEYTDISRLAFYSHLFNSIEINSSFYKLPQAQTLAKWSVETTDNFRFTFKVWKELTHNKNLAFITDNVARFFNAINAVGDKKGCLLVQFPASIQSNSVVQVCQLLSAIKENNPDNAWPVMVEFRHPSWYNETVYELLENTKAGLVYQDWPTAATPFTEPITDTVYLRFHGPERGYRGSYAHQHLHEYAVYIREWLSDGKTVYTYFNNTAGSALANLQELDNELATWNG
jgi:uncharacterized protein YecE (DUF72 family)